MFVRELGRTVFVLSLLAPLLTSSPCQSYGCSKNLFVPAPPGHTPSCAKHGETFCEHIEHYPEHVIEYLIEKWQVDYNSIFANERRDSKPRPVYGPPSYPYPPKTRFPSHYGGRPRDYLHPPPSQHFNTLFSHPFNLTEYEYPDRKYPFSPSSSLQFINDDPGFIYSALIHPELAGPPVTRYDPNKWWKRYTRIARKKRETAPEDVAAASGKKKRIKRQSAGATQLCPTSPRFIAPQAALNNKGNWMYVVNLDTDQRYRQLVRSETCISSQCSGICSLPNGYTSRCEQQFVQKRLVALDGGGDNLYTDLFWLPHCCICQITQTNR